MTELTRARAFAAHWFQRRAISLRDVTHKPGLFNTFYLDYQDSLMAWKKENMKVSFAGLKKEELKAAFEEYITDVLEDQRFKDLEHLRCGTESLNPILTWVKAVTGQESELDAAIIAHWVWMIKRKAFRKPVKYTVMPILYGPQGSGKSMALNNLIRPLVQYQMNIRMNQLSDERVFESMANNLVVLFDELQGIERTDLNVLKNQISTEFNTYRKLHTHTVVSVPMNCSFIGATNKPVNESFSDSTGMRRFHQIRTLPRLDWSIINSIDYEALWKGVDETKEHGYLVGQALEAAATAQAQMVNEEDIEVFIKEHRLRVDASGFKLVPAKALYNAYRNWCHENGVKNVLNNMWFNRKLLNKDISSELKKVEGKKEQRYFKVSLDCDVDAELSLNQTLLEFKKA